MKKSEIIRLVKILMISTTSFFILTLLLFLSLYFLLVDTIEGLDLTFSVSFTTMLIIVTIISCAIVIYKLKSYSNKMQINEPRFSKVPYKISNWYIIVIASICIGLTSTNYFYIYNLKQKEKKEIELFNNFAKYRSNSDTIRIADVKILIDSLNSIDK